MARVRESVAAYRRRTGAPYAPPPSLARAATPLAGRESCPTLYRFPGAAGIARCLRDPRATLAELPGNLVWLSEEAPGSPGARCFGALVVPCPLVVHACRSREPGHWIAADAPISSCAAWLPPEALQDPARFRDVATPAQARRLLGRSAAAARARVLTELGRYFEELAALRASGTRAPRLPWCDIPAARRRRLLEEHGIPRRWTT